MKSLLSLLVIIPLFLISCNPGETPPVDEKPLELLPLEVGNTWTYETFTYHGSNRDGLVKMRENVTKVTGRDTILGYHWFIVDDDYYKEPTPYMNREDGLWYYETETSLPTFLYKYPTKMGDISYEPGLEFTTISVDTKIVTPAGTFTSIVYKDTTFKPIIMAFCPGVGMIRNQHVKSINDIGGIPDTLWEEFILKSYTLK